MLSAALSPRTSANSCQYNATSSGKQKVSLETLLPSAQRYPALLPQFWGKNSNNPVQNARVRSHKSSCFEGQMAPLAGGCPALQLPSARALSHALSADVNPPQSVRRTLSLRVFLLQPHTPLPNLMRPFHDSGAFIIVIMQINYSALGLICQPALDYESEESDGSIRSWRC